MHYRLVPVPVVDDSVALGGIDHALDVILRLTGNADQGVDVGAHCKLEHVGADCGRGAVDDEGDGLGSWGPWLREIETVVGIQTDGCGQRSEWDRGTL